MKRLMILSCILACCLHACQSNQTEETRERREHTEKEAPGYEESEEENERGEPITGNENKPEPVPVNYVNAARCDSITQPITYNTHVRQIVNTRCAVLACHDAATKANGINLEGYANTRQTFEHGKGFCSVTHDFEARCRHMPTTRIKLTDRDINLLLCWAKTGYAE